jgi:CubicO group peptidase (beta-lactamase class C family)
MEIKDLIDENFTGCISVRKNGNIIFQNAYGYSDLPNKIKNEIDTKFATASAGKVFVAVGILQLIECDKLHFNDCICDILDYDLKNIDQTITIKQLLNHTSGIPDYFDESIMEEYDELWIDYPNYKIRTSEDLLPLFIDKPMMYPPGERFQYNNTGFVVLGLIIEKIVGIPFDEYLKEFIFKPCNMLNTGYYELDRLPSKCANSYIFDNNRKEFYTNIYSVDVKGTGAGGAFTTIFDVENFWDCLLKCKLISKEMLDKMLSVQTLSDSVFYGYGIWLDKVNDDKYFPHFEGCDPGVSFISSYNTDENISITLLSNFQCDVWKLRREIQNELKA